MQFLKLERYKERRLDLSLDQVVRMLFVIDTAMVFTLGAYDVEIETDRASAARIALDGGIDADMGEILFSPITEPRDLFYFKGTKERVPGTMTNIHQLTR